MQSRTPIWQYAVIAVALVFVPASVWWYLKSERPKSRTRLHDTHLRDAVQIDAQKAQDMRTITFPYRSEYEWITRDTIEHIAAQLSMAAGQPASEPPVFTAKTASGVLTISTTLNGKTCEARMATTNNPWNPDLYLPVCTQIADALKAGSPDTGDSNKVDVLEELMDPSPEALWNTNLRVSRMLRQKPLDPYLNEHAAMLLANFALKENTGAFNNLMHSLNKMTAHLAIAGSRRQGATRSDAGALAGIALSMFAGREVEATGALDSLQPNAGTTTVKAWLDVLRLRNTGDWTKVSDPVNTPDIMRIEYVRELAKSVSSDYAIEFIEKFKPVPVPDWSRSIRGFGCLSVGNGHVFARDGLAGEYGESINTYCRMNNTEPQAVTDEQMIEFLNRVPPPAWECRDGRFRVIEVEDFAQFHQRHLILAIWSYHDFLKNMYGVKEEAAELRKEIKKRFGGLRLLGGLELQWAESQEEYNAAMEAVGKVASSHPELLDEATWSYARTTPKLYRYHNVVPFETGWFTEGMIPGTTYNILTRYEFPQVWKHDSAFFGELLKLAPQNYFLITTYINKRMKEADGAIPADFDEIVGPTVNYMYGMMFYVARLRKDDTSTYLRTMRRMCELKPSNYFALGHWLVEQKKDEQAMKAYENGVTYCEDAVCVANSVDWLVNYYYDHDRRNDAIKLAEWAADVYSFAGLETMMKLQERMGDLKKAEKYGQDIEERYENSRPLLFFYRRHKDTADYAQHFEAKLKPVFPQGLKEVRLADFKTAPTNGIVMLDKSKSLEKAGLKPGCVVVALDGYQTETVKQYETVREFTNSPDMSLIIWQDGRYGKVNVSLPNRRFGVGIDTYVPGNFDL